MSFPRAHSTPRARASYDFPTAQVALGATGAKAELPASARASWYAGIGSYAKVRAGGPLEDRAGQRVRLSYFDGFTSKVAYAFVDATPDPALDRDIVITRRLFAALAPIAEHAITLTVETLSGGIVPDLPAAFDHLYPEPNLAPSPDLIPS